jgi:putative flavoprotein involved in K+ transport
VVLKRIRTVVVGGGQAGLAVSRELGQRGVEHVVLEQARVAQAWRDRWDSFTLVTPNWTMDLPGTAYRGDDPEGHVERDEIVRYLEDYSTTWRTPVREGVRVGTITAGSSSRFELATSKGDIESDVVVVCTGAFQRPQRPVADQFPAGLAVIDALDYRIPDALPNGQVLLIGSGQTGCQLAEELHRAGRNVFLSCGRAPWVPRRLDELDIVTWLTRVDFYDQRLEDLPSPAERLVANAQSTGEGGGHDLHYRTLQDLGVVLLGRIAGVDGHHARFADDLAASVAFGDTRWEDARRMLRERLPAKGYRVPELPVPRPFRYTPVTDVDLRDFGAVIFTSGYRPDFGWIDFPICDELGYPITVNGASPGVPGLYFCGIHFMRIRRSGFLYGVGEDAAIVAGAIAANERTQTETAQAARANNVTSSGAAGHASHATWAE